MQRLGGIARGAQGDDRQAEDRAHDAAQPACGLASAALFDPLQEMESFGGGDLGNRPAGKAAAICELVGLRFRLGVLDVEVGQGHWGYRPWGYFEIAPNSTPNLSRSNVPPCDAMRTETAASH